MSTSYGGDQITFPDASTQNTAATGFGFKNRIINGAMVIDQRNAGASVTPIDGQYTLDRWIWQQVTAGKCTIAQSSTSATGFTKSLLITSTSAYTPLTGDVMTIGQRIEGFNVADLGWGTASAQTITVSFWVRSSLTGSFGGTLRNGASNRSYPFLFTISSANTFEYKTVTVAGDTSGTWATESSAGLQLSFAAGCGATYLGTAGAWATAPYYSATGATNLVGTSGATLYITGVQLEKGSTATSFDYRPYGTELALCQRYFYKTFAQEVAPANGLALPTDSNVAMYGVNNGQGMYFTYPVTMRATPTITYYRGLSKGATDGQWAYYTGSAWTSATATTTTSVSSVGFTPVLTTGTLVAFSSYLLSGHYTSAIEL